MSSIIFGPFKLLGNAHLFFRWPVGVDMWCRSCRPEVRIRRRVCEKIRRISNLLKTFEVRTLSNSNANFVTSLENNLVTDVIVDLELNRHDCWSAVCGNKFSVCVCAVANHNGNESKNHDAVQQVIHQ